MGADIHAYAEFRNDAGQWQAIREYEPFEGRNYNAFSFFAGVRFRNDFHGRYVMFTGALYKEAHPGRYVNVQDEPYWVEMCVTPHPIAQPRGLPEDVSPSVKAESDRWAPDGHSHSWLSVDELTSYNYDKPLRDRNIESVPEDFVNCTIREALTEYYFSELTRLENSGAERIVFWFDN